MRHTFRQRDAPWISEKDFAKITSKRPLQLYDTRRLIGHVYETKNDYREKDVF